MDKNDFLALKQDLIEWGYEQREPEGLAYDIDCSVCYESQCPKCKRPGMDYVPFIEVNYLTQKKSYRAFAVCPECGWAEEF